MEMLGKLAHREAEDERTRVEILARIEKDEVPGRSSEQQAIFL